MTDKPEQAIVVRARQMLVDSHEWGGAVESGILSGAWDDGEAIADFFNPAEQELMREQMEDIADD
ncbi:MAG: hypothetical protein ABJC88_16965 [Parasphingorhabdus sp.]|uniref:hypothetical protein n=1 Tax=Sphingomonadales TaxID=204457 RepID=UPI00326647B2